ncbi:MAG TPA: hypothetical protein DCS23_01485 [Candidatus Yonathbacteria bacterium]|nr:hypothetical protein [Candidatus Yonathbacteria bacterium]
MTSIQDLTKRIKGYADEHRPKLHIIPDDLFLGLIIILVAFGSFGLGRLSKIEGSKTPVRFEGTPPQSSKKGGAFSEANTATNNQLVASKNGTKYYYSWCTGVSKISPANLIYLGSKEEAEARGYTPSATCKGL